MCQHHARNRIGVQNNALISTIIFDLKQVNDFVKFLAANVYSIKTDDHNLGINLSDHIITVVIWILSHNARNS